MRRLIWIVLIMALGWCAWWWIATNALQRSLTDWFDARRDAGWLAEVRQVEKGGFPLRLQATLERPALADPQTGTAVEFSELTLSAPAYWPGYATLRFPDDGIDVATPQGRSTVTAKDATAVMRLHPGTALELETLSLTADAWGISTELGPLVSAEGLTLSAREIAPETYTIDLAVPALEPGQALREQLFVPADWPVSFDQMVAVMDVTFDRTWDRRSLEERRPQPRRIALHKAEAAWGELLLRAAGTLDVDPSGHPSGQMALQVRNWRDMLVLAQTTGAAPPQVWAQVERALSAMAGLSGNPDALDVTLTFKNGLVMLGFVPLAPAPRLILR